MYNRYGEVPLQGLPWGQGVSTGDLEGSNQSYL